MTLTELRYIVTLAEERHFGRAAERCHVSQPTLSVAVRKLEDELGVPLFERAKHALSLTRTGEQVVQQAQRVLAQVNVIHDIASQGKDQLSGPLRVGAIYTIGPYLFPHLLPELRRVAPAMPLYIEENYTAVLRERLLKSQLDAILVALPFAEGDVATLPLYDEPFVVVLPAGHRLCHHDTIDSAEIAEEDLLLLGPGHCFRDQVLEACPTLIEQLSPGSRQRPNRVITEGSSLETIRHMVASGLGVSILPLSAVPERGAGKQLIEVRPLTSPTPFRTVGLAWRVSFPRPKAIDLLGLAAGQCRVLEKHAD